MELNRVIHGDCYPILKAMPDNAFDLVLTDPPYGIKEAAGKNKSRGKLAISQDFGNLSWDNHIPSKEIFAEIFRVSKNQIIFGGNYFTEHLKNSPCWIVWDKINGSSDFADCELIYTSFKSAVRLFRYQWNGMLQNNMKDKDTRIHPTQKPKSLLVWLLEKFTKPGETILDPFLGSGTTAVASIELDRQWLGIEQEAQYCKSAINRVKQEQAQGKLF